MTSRAELTPRVLHVLRTDHATHLGGDLLQLMATVDGLGAEGVDAIAATIDEAPSRVDVVHLYNLQRPAALVSDLRVARRRWPNASVVVSPVWWPWRFRGMVGTGERAVGVRAVKQAAKQTAWWPFVRRLLASADLVLPNSDAEILALKQTYRLRTHPNDDRRWAVIPNGIHLDRWPVARASPEVRAETLSGVGIDPAAAPIVACVARIEPVKNQLALLRSFERLPRAALLLIGPSGDDAYTSSVKAMAASSGLRGRVAFLGRREHGEVARLLAAVDVHVLASFRETPGLATLEAAATGCAVVVSAEGSALEYLGGTAHVADPTDAVSIADAITAATADPRQPAARHRVERFDWSASVGALRQAYARLPGFAPTTRS